MTKGLSRPTRQDCLPILSGIPRTGREPNGRSLTECRCRWKKRTDSGRATRTTRLSGDCYTAPKHFGSGAERRIDGMQRGRDGEKDERRYGAMKQISSRCSMCADPQWFADKACPQWSRIRQGLGHRALVSIEGPPRPDSGRIGAVWAAEVPGRRPREGMPPGLAASTHHFKTPPIGLLNTNGPLSRHTVPAALLSGLGRFSGGGLHVSVPAGCEDYFSLRNQRDIRSSAPQATRHQNYRVTFLPLLLLSCSAADISALAVSLMYLFNPSI